MIFAKTLIELVQARLAGGDSQADLRGVWHPLTVATQIGLTLDDLVADNPSMAKAMAIDIPVVFGENPLVGTLQYSVITPRGVYAIVSGNTQFNIVSSADFITFPQFNPGVPVAKISNKTITFSQPAQYINNVLSAAVTAIPNFKELPKDAPVILEENQVKLVDLVVERMKRMDEQDLLNNSTRKPMGAKARR